MRTFVELVSNDSAKGCPSPGTAFEPFSMFADFKACSNQRWITSTGQAAVLTNDYAENEIDITHAENRAKRTEILLARLMYVWDMEKAATSNCYLWPSTSITTITEPKVTTYDYLPVFNLSVCHLSVYHLSVDLIGWPIRLPALLFPPQQPPSFFCREFR
jgi:hypothetical protein